MVERVEVLAPSAAKGPKVRHANWLGQTVRQPGAVWGMWAG